MDNSMNKELQEIIAFRVECAELRGYHTALSDIKDSGLTLSELAETLQQRIEDLKERYQRSGK